jgi:hypothetical protein
MNEYQNDDEMPSVSNCALSRESLESRREAYTVTVQQSQSDFKERLSSHLAQMQVENYY